jgi:hypothetical protein
MHSIGALELMTDNVQATSDGMSMRSVANGQEYLDILLGNESSS